MERRWTLRLVTLLVWAAAIASAVYWGWRFNTSRQVTAPPPLAGAAPTISALGRQQDIARLLGAVPASDSTAANANRFSLIGVITAGASGAALLSVDGQPARPYPLGARIDGNTVLQSVGPRHAVLAASMDGPALQRLDLPIGSTSISAPANNPAPAPTAQGAMPSSVPPNPPGVPNGIEMRRPDPGPAGPPQAPR